MAMAQRLTPVTWPGAHHPAPATGRQASAASGDEIWRSAMDAFPEPIAVLDEHGVIIAVNEPWLRVARDAGRTEDDVGRSYLAECDRASADTPAAAEAAALIRAVIAGTRPPVTGVEYQLGDRWFVMTVRACQGAGTAVVVRHEDVTVRRRSARNLAEARGFLATVTDSMGEGLIVLDVEGRVQLMNPAAEVLLGWPLEIVQGEVMHHLTHALSHAGSQPSDGDCPLLTAPTDGRVVRVGEDVFVRRDGTPLSVAYTAAPLGSTEEPAGCVVVFLDATHLRAEERRLRAQVEELTWRQRILAALDEDRLRLHTQPIVRLRDGTKVQQELLLRVHEPDGTLSAPAPFLGAAERYGLAGRIDRWVVRRALALAALTGERYEVNVSAVSLTDRTLLSDLSSWRKEAGVDPGQITFEVTETAIISDEESARAFVRGLREQGFSVALDDFGTGYAGFSYLKNLPVDVVKIDREFVKDLTWNNRSRHVVEAVVSLAGRFGLQTVAEGVEDEATLTALRGLGVDMAQGYHLGQPVLCATQ